LLHCALINFYLAKHLYLPNISSSFFCH
jgi:hypothetical protein